MRSDHLLHLEVLMAGLEDEVCAVGRSSTWPRLTRVSHDWMTFNGYAGQYVKHPLTAKPGELVRFWVVDAGPSLDTDFHIVGTILNTAYPFGDMNPADALHNVQTVTVPAGGGVFDVKIDQPGLYPFVSHAFAAVDQGQVGLLNVGNVKGTMSH